MDDGTIVVRDLRKAFGDVDVLRGVDLDVPRGSVVALLGSNGAGKTTAVRVLATLLRPDGGTARVNGFDVVAEPAHVRASISLTGQFTAVDDVLTGRENLVLVAKLRHLADPATIAAEACATNAAPTFPAWLISPNHARSFTPRFAAISASEVLSTRHVISPSTSAGAIPASSSAALIACSASIISERPDSRE